LPSSARPSSPGEKPLPVYQQTFASIASGLLRFWKPFGFLRATRRTVTSHADLRWGHDHRGVRRLLHPNGICLTGVWKIDAAPDGTAYTGYFRPGSEGLTGLRDWSKTTIFGGGGEVINVTATPAQHGPRWFPGVRHVRGFVLEWPGQEHGALYISGDTVYFDELRGLTDRFVIGTALLHLGAVHLWPPLPWWWRFTFNGAEAVKMAQMLHLKTLIPIHYERSVWSHFREDVASYQRAFEASGLRDKVHWLRPGLRTPLNV
jgi:hypothetical protein